MVLSGSFQKSCKIPDVIEREQSLLLGGCYNPKAGKVGQTTLVLVFFFPQVISATQMLLGHCYFPLKLLPHCDTEYNISLCSALLSKKC